MLKIRTLGRVCTGEKKIIKEAKGESKKVSVFTSVAHPKTHFALFKYVHAPISLLLIAIIYLININSVGHSISVVFPYLLSNCAASFTSPKSI